MNILLSAGHNPSARGAEHNGHTEHGVATRWINKIAQIVSQARESVLIVPTGTLTSKVNYINANNAKLALELHFNSDASKRQKGSESLYCPGSSKGKIFADIIQQEFINLNLFQPNRGSKEGWYQMDKPGHIDYKGDIDGDEKIDYFLHKTNCVSIILEPEFIYNIDIIQNNEDAACKAIADGIIKFCNK